MDVMASSCIVCVLWLLVATSISYSGFVECKEESKRDTARDAPVIEIRTVEKTDQRIEVEIASSILIQTTWYGDIFIEAGDVSQFDRFNGRVLLPLAEESEATVWMHTRIEGDLIITTAGVAKSNPSGNQDYLPNVELRIISENNAIWYTRRFEWGAEDVDTSLFPVVEAIPPSLIQPDQGEDVEASAVVKGDAIEVVWTFLNVRQNDVSTGLHPNVIYESAYVEESEKKKGVHASSRREANAIDRTNTTTASIAITDTSSESNLGYYTCEFVSNDYQSVVYLYVDVLPTWITRQVSQEPILLHVWSSLGAVADGGSIGMAKGMPGQIQCIGFGYPVNDITIVHHASTAPTETSLTTGYGVATMYLKNVQEEDVGTYTCVIKSHDRVFKREFSVMLIEPIDADFVVVSQKEDEVRMSCSARGYPVPSLVLSRMDSLTYMYVDLQDGGIYDIDVTRDENGHTVTAVLTVSETTDEYYSDYSCTAVSEFEEVTEWLEVYHL